MPKRFVYQRLLYAGFYSISNRLQFFLSIPHHDKHFKLLFFFTLCLIFSLLFPVLWTAKPLFYWQQCDGPLNKESGARNKKRDSAFIVVLLDFQHNFIYTQYSIFADKVLLLHYKIILGPRKMHFRSEFLLYLKQAAV